MSIKGYVEELNNLNEEIKRNNTLNKNLKTRVKELELNIADYLRSKDQTGVKYNGQAIILESKEKHLVKKKKDKEHDVMLFLKNLGVSNTEKAYEELQKVQRGNVVEHQKLKVKMLY